MKNRIFALCWKTFVHVIIVPDKLIYLSNLTKIFLFFCLQSFNLPSWTIPSIRHGAHISICQTKPRIFLPVAQENHFFKDTMIRKWANRLKEVLSPGVPKALALSSLFPPITSVMVAERSTNGWTVSRGTSVSSVAIRKRDTYVEYADESTSTDMNWRTICPPNTPCSEKIKS